MKTIQNMPDAESNGMKIVFSDYLIEAIHANQDNGVGSKNMKRTLELVTLLENKEAECFELSDDQYNMLYKSLQKLSGNPRLAKQLVPYYEAVEAAKPVKV